MSAGGNGFEVDYSRGELDAGDIAELKAQDARERRESRSFCAECGCTGHHLSGCPGESENGEGEGDA